MGMKTFTIKRVVHEYYQVEAETKSKALLVDLEDPFFVDHQSSYVVSESWPPNKVDSPDPIHDEEVDCDICKDGNYVFECPHK